MKWNTFDGWLAEKLWVIKGQKSILDCPVTGLPLFNENQVRKRPYSGFAYYDAHWKMKELRAKNGNQKTSI